MLYAVALGRLIAVRLGLKGDTITQEVAWNLDGVCTGMGNGSNPVILGQTLYLAHGSGMIVKAVDAATGKILASSSGLGTEGYTINLGFTRDRAVWKGGKLDQSMSSSDKDNGVATYTVVGVPDLKPRGNGYLWPEKPTGEIAERHIAVLGYPRLTLSNSVVACWGNRICIRDNDYLWCIGDPAKPSVSPKDVKPEPNPSPRGCPQTADKHEHPSRWLSAAEKPRIKQNPLKAALLSLVTSCLLLNAALAGETASSSIDPAVKADGDTLRYFHGSVGVPINHGGGPPV